MDSLHTVLRSLRSEEKSRRDHLSVFREFLDHLDRIARSRTARMRETRSKREGAAAGRRTGKG